jgi:mono/diheme cytochrome c family protein
MKRSLAVLIAVACACLGTAAAQDKGAKAPSADVKRGRYLVQTTGCNDCHTAGYPESAGKVDEKLWLTGSPLGWRGPWGTTYASNLRLVAQKMTEAQFVQRARSELRPPMPWFNVRDMTESDVRAIYRYLRHLGPAGSDMPAYVPPDKEPKPPFVQFPAPPK